VFSKCICQSAGQNRRGLRCSSVTYFVAICSLVAPRPCLFWLAHTDKAILKTRPNGFLLSCGIYSRFIISQHHVRVARIAGDRCGTTCGMGIGAGFQPFRSSGAVFLGRWPRLVWSRAFGAWKMGSLWGVVTGQRGSDRRWLDGVSPYQSCFTAKG